MRNFTITTNIIIVVFLFFAGQMKAQIIRNPTLEITSRACASDTFNSFEAEFVFEEGSINTSSNQFILELSDENGSFSNPEILFTSAIGAITTSPGIIDFSLPTTAAGDAYKIRIKSTETAFTSSGSKSFAAYYKIQNTPFTINNLNDTAVYCAGGSYLLTIDNPGTGENDSPLQYPSLTFRWYRETSPTTSVFVTDGASLAVSEPGTYFVETNYGPCSTPDSSSNKVTVSQASSGGASTDINSSLGNPYCSSLGETTLSTVSGGDSYQWFKDGNEIDGAITETYVTDQSGLYEVNVSLGTCSTSGSINLDANQFTSSIDVDEKPDVNLLPASGTLTITLIDTATNPEYEWYLNDVLIPGATSDSFDATQTGDYKAVIKQTVGCISSKEFLFAIQETFPDVENIPNLISPNGDGVNDTWVIPKEYISGTNADIVIISSQGKIVFQTNDYQNNWPDTELNLKDVNPVYYYIITTEGQKTKKGSITVIK
ncbi:gliding motility-associated C-terminal domain-containing protein [Flavivirga amylovorans]|uniref:Gliding motility-associated C-terminal domain-containing protein n=1 Tax=Flavivirga amylovorans TaxID=870486 RepID=A0ABT8X1Z0_9FLAO|nr:gliding motility-associated C-terminal domain-containing protein [Flavivirga amylovorans]MDO5987624.1 gliding motility-associated C-terminal domain-containing protein [Flavivirga amylovorans]